MTRKYSSISVETTLASGISNNQTTMTVATGAGSALMGGVTLAVGNVDQFTVALDVDTQNEEIVFVTGVSGDTLTIVRAQAGSSGISHSGGATVKHVLTSSDLTFYTTGVATADAAVPSATVTAKADILVGASSGVVDNLAVGTNGQVLTANSAQTLGLNWTTPATGDVTLTGVQTLTNKKLSDSTTTIVDVTDATKAIKFDVAGTTAITGTIATAFTTAKTLTLPDATDTLVGKATTDTLTNKTLTAPVISTITNTGTLTLPTSTDTLVGKATTDTLTNKTLSSAVLTGTVTAGGGVGTSGQVLASTGTGVQWSTPSASSSGLVFIARSTVTASTTLTMDSVLSDTYTAYVIVFDNFRGAGAGGGDLIMQLRYGTTTNTTNYDTCSISINTSGTVASYAGATPKIITLGSVDTGAFSSASITLARRTSGLSQYPTWSGTGFDLNVSKTYLIGGGIGIYNGANTGIILSNSGATNMTGTVSIYGLATA